MAMLGNEVKINKVDNGYIVSTVKYVFGQQHPEQEINVFKDWKEVEDFLFPKQSSIQVK